MDYTRLIYKKNQINMDGLFKKLNESINKYELKDFPIGAIVHMDDEEWKVVKPGVKNGKIFMAPFNRVAKDRYISVAIEYDLNWLNANVKSISESEINENAWDDVQVGVFVRYKKDKSNEFTGGKVISIKGSQAEIQNWDGSTTELSVKDLEYIKSWNEGVNEGREQIKRKYAEHGAIRVNETAPVRNEILRFVNRRFITEEEMTNFLTKMTETRGKDLNAKLWFERNSRYFEKFENRGQQVWTLSKFGKRVLEFIKRKDSSNGKINESVGLFKLNESSKLDCKVDGKTVDISSIELKDVHKWDRPDYADAYASYAEFVDGKKLSDSQLDKLTNEHPDIINQLANENS